MKKIISILLAVMMLCSTAVTVLAADTPSKEYPQKFWDVPKDHWAFSYIAELEDRGVIAGYEDGSFKPNKTVTRAEWAKIMVLAAGLPLVYVFDRGDHYIDAYFYDTLDHWARPYINTAKDYLAGYTDDTFRPDQAAVREDVTVSMVKLKGYDVSEVDYSYLSRFSDVNSISNSLKAYVSAAVEKDLIDGFEDGTFRGQDTLTRAEAATLLWRAFQHGNDNKVVEPTETITETPKLAEQPKATEKLKATLKPTPKPTPEPEPTEEPTPEPTEKPYKVDTVAKADVKNSYSFTFDNDNTIYYCDSSNIYAINISDKSTDIIADLDDMTIDNDEMTLSDFSVSSICWDNNSNRILFTGKYDSINSAKDINNSFLCEISDGAINVLTDSYKHDEIIGTLSNGDYVSDLYIIDFETFEDKDYYAGQSGQCSFVEADNGIYYIGERHSYLDYYDFVKINILWDVGYSELTDAFGPVYKYDYAGGIKENTVVTFGNNEIQSYNFNGKKLENIKKTDIKVNDKSALDFNNIKYKLLITDDNDIIFYDETAKAFRMISENK